MNEIDLGVKAGPGITLILYIGRAHKKVETDSKARSSCCGVSQQFLFIAFC